MSSKPTLRSLQRDLDLANYQIQALRRFSCNLARVVAVLEYAKSGSGGFSYTPSYGGAVFGDPDGATGTGVRNNPTSAFKDVPTDRLLSWCLRDFQL